MKKAAFLGLRKNNKEKSAGFTSKNRGQATMESMLLMTVLLGLFLAVKTYIQDKKLLTKMVAGPIKNVAAMTAYGTWKEECTAPGKSKKFSAGKCHPNSIARALSSNPKP